MNAYLYHAQRLFPLCMFYNFFELHFGYAIFAIFLIRNSFLDLGVKIEYYPKNFILFHENKK
jgi:hypothetical protein